MIIFKNIARLFAFTENEKRVIIVLVLGLIIGMGISAYKGYNSDIEISDYTELYAERDSIFLARSAAIPDKSDGRSAPPLVLLAPNSININTASKEELTLLPGIGDAYAERIILYREDYGAFTSVEDLVKVRGIGPRRLEQIKPYITY
jgi:competence ComEA-like helix-hairpin-helix protein